MNPFLPGSTIGLLGGGQLGRMFALEARGLGYSIHCFEPSTPSPCAPVADRVFTAPYEDADALSDFARSVDLATYEFENIPIEAFNILAEHTLIRPKPEILHICQHRQREKEFLARHGYPVVPFKVVTSYHELAQAIQELGTPSVLKTTAFGYDGKGQIKVGDQDSPEVIWNQHPHSSGILEQWVDYDAEVSVIVARGVDGQSAVFPMALNDHQNHILAQSIAPALVDPSIEEKANRLARDLADQLDLVGLLTVEMFLTRAGELLINELAPRPHNSGHYTMDACVTSQFEQHLRAVAGLPLGSTAQLRPAVMRNLLGDLWSPSPPPWAKLLELPGLKLHLYGKRHARPGRKMGHYTVIADSIEEAREVDESAQRILLEASVPHGTDDTRHHEVCA